MFCNQQSKISLVHAGKAASFAASGGRQFPTLYERRLTSIFHIILQIAEMNEK